MGVPPGRMGAEAGRSGGNFGVARLVGAEVDPPLLNPCTGLALVCSTFILTVGNVVPLFAPDTCALSPILGKFRAPYSTFMLVWDEFAPPEGPDDMRFAC